MGGRLASTALSHRGSAFECRVELAGAGRDLPICSRNPAAQGVKSAKYQAPSLPGQGLNAAQSGGAPMLPTLPDGNAPSGGVLQTAVWF